MIPPQEKRPLLVRKDNNALDCGSDRQKKEEPKAKAVGPHTRYSYVTEKGVFFVVAKRNRCSHYRPDVGRQKLTKEKRSLLLVQKGNSALDCGFDRQKNKKKTKAKAVGPQAHTQGAAL